jgi:hypothetical protein
MYWMMLFMQATSSGSPRFDPNSPAEQQIASVDATCNAVWHKCCYITCGSNTYNWDMQHVRWIRHTPMRTGYFFVVPLYVKP